MFKMNRGQINCPQGFHVTFKNLQHPWPAAPHGAAGARAGILLAIAFIRWSFFNPLG